MDSLFFINPKDESYILDGIDTRPLRESYKEGVPSGEDDTELLSYQQSVLDAIERIHSIKEK